MQKKSKLSLIVTALCLLIAVLTLVLPSMYKPDEGKAIIGFITTFSGKIKIAQGAVKVKFSVGSFITFLLPLLCGLLVFVYGSSQKSTYFFSLCFFIAGIIMYMNTKHFFVNINVSGWTGAASCNMSAGPYVNTVLCSFGIIFSLFGMFYKEDKRLSRRY